ncbi:MAG: Vitamin B12 import ATP-binding protein BtuD [Chroococcopsis gigantea SAG 12.99]|jgi:ATP-binding cassette subfamily B protein|nr:ABC transporter ATP-binding protein [Chlorogloea purpurea SAG 13.99]MDV3002193.1 Vitamin B12 import ATP-binding protein BtuD [Chroococcopsis gigantea SAG 12.99]
MSNPPLNIKRTLKLIWDSGSRWMIANCTLVIIQGLLPVITLQMTKLIIDAVTAGINSTDKGPAFDHVKMLIGLAVFVAVLEIIAKGAGKIINDIQAQLMTDYIYKLLHTKSLEVDLEYYENSDYYDTLHQAQSQAVFRPFNIMLEIIAVAQYAISLVAIVILLASLHPAIALTLFAAALPGVFVRLKLSKRQFQWAVRSTPTERKANYISQILTGDTHAKELRLFALGDYFQGLFLSLREQLRREKQDLVVRRSIQEGAIELGSTLAVFGTFAFIAYRTLGGFISLGQLVMYYQAFQKGQEFLERMMRNLSMLYEDSLFLSNFYKFLDLKPQVIESSHPIPVPAPFQKGIAFNNVFFDYPNTTRKVLKGINLSIEPGAIIALVGENGAGKTTLIKLLCRLYDPTQGNITIDGIDLREFSLKNLRQQFSVIFQDYAKYHLTAKENVWFGDIELDPDDEKIIRAAYRSGADKVVNSLPQKYGTILGKLFADGEELSIGQWQKIALARAFLRNSGLIVLDEPTSAMDPKAEYEVFNTFRELLQDQSAILISHRLSTVKMADRIYVLERGELIEQGSHEELMTLGGTYAQLFERQAQQYLV